ncbi:unnamed protein product [Caenorhabditis angaria]|uniref:Conserved oligomeric Golgi complex subunit 6 n=1 Tax=Caenorhabditis angaria TaxID=860376 RepID=A0A9P1NAN2_9PELO|nr:unnamed protein product [Caenorhabditis angaria]
MTTTGKTVNPLKSKIDAVVTRKLNLDKEFLKVVDYVAPLMESIDIDNHAERKLSRKLEAREIEINKNYLLEFEKVNKIVQQFDNIVQNMNASCTNLCVRLENVKQTNTNLLNQTTQLQALKKNIEVKQKAIDNFLDKYSLTEGELEALDCEHKEVRLTPQFFAALNRAKEIHDDSKEMIKNSGNHIAALEVMESMEKIMKGAYTTIFNKISREFRLLSSDFIDAKNVISRALCALQDFPYMLQVSLDEYSTSRGNDVLRQYIEALTKGPHGSGKPIEMMSHDKTRYIGDMLAFMYEITENEKELVVQLLSQCQADVLETYSLSVLNNITKVLASPFKVRVEQSLASETDCVVLYNVSNLFTFYMDKFQPLTGPKSELVLCLNDLHSISMTIFHAGLIQSVQKLLTKMGAPDYDLLPVQAVHQCLMLFREVLDTHDTGMGTKQFAKEGFQKIFEIILDPLTREIQLTATQLHSPLDVAVYTLNCLSSIQSVVVLYQYTDKRLEMINAMIESNEDVLVSEEISTILSTTKLLTIYQKAAAHSKEQGPLSQITGMDRANVSAVLNEFSMFLHNPNSCRLDHVAKISSSRIRETVRSRSMSELLKVYSCLVSKFQDESNGYNDMQYLSTEQVGQLLQFSFMQ